MRRNAYGSRGYTETMNRDEASLDKNFSALRIFNGNLVFIFQRSSLLKCENSFFKKEIIRKENNLLLRKFLSSRTSFN